MGNVLLFKTESRERVAGAAPDPGGCEIVIFPGVRIERQDTTDPDSGRPPSGHGKVDGTSSRRRARKTS